MTYFQQSMSQYDKQVVVNVTNQEAQCNLEKKQMRTDETQHGDLAQYFSILAKQIDRDTSAPFDIAAYQQSKSSSTSYSVNLSQYLKIHHQINYDLRNFQAKIESSIMYHTNNYQVLKLQVEYGYFGLHMNVLNVDAKSQSDSLQFIQSGGFGEVCKSQFEGKQIAIKRIRIFENKLQQTLQSVIKEYFLLIIASALHCGPKIHKIYGFDLVLFRDYIQFSMEFCVKNQKQRSQLQQLKEKLFLMHRLHFIHCDIKPENIAYCSSYRSYVFLDFGLGLLVKEKLGEKKNTGFMGSIQYCGKDMWDLFMKNTSGKIDLYLNDAIFLEKSLEVLKEEPVSQNTEKQWEQCVNNSNSKNEVLFNQKRILIMIKSIFFHKAMNSCMKIDNFFTYKKYFSFFMSKIVDFIKLLPLDKNLVNFYRQYCHIRQEDCLQNEINRNNVRSIRKPTADLDYSCQKFIERFHLIKSLKLGLYAIQKIQSKSTDINFSQQIEDNFSAYLLTIIKIIKINGQTDNFDDKIIACKNFLTVFKVEYTKMSDVQIYKQVILHIFKHCATNFSEQNRDIFANVILTTIIFQVVPESEILSSFELIVKSQTAFVKKIAMVMEFVTSLEFIKEKYKSSYSYDRLMNSFMLQLNDYLDLAFQTHKFIDKEQLIFYRLKELICEKTNCLKQVKNKSVLEVYLPVIDSRQYLNGSELLLHDIETYLAYCEGGFLLGMIYRMDIKGLNYISRELSMRFNHSSSFSYLHFAYYLHHYHYKHDHYFSQAYKLFQLQLGKFQEISTFKICFLQKIKGIHNYILSNCKDYFFYIDKSHQNYLLFQLQQILLILQQIIDHQSNYHYYVDQFYTLIMTMESNKAILRLVCDFLNKNISKIIKFSQISYDYSQCKHDSHMRIEINNIFNTISIYNSFNKNNKQDLLAHFMKQVIEFVDCCKCFFCKISSLLEIRMIKAFKRTNYDPEQQFMGLVDLLAFYLKVPGHISDVTRTILNLVRYWGKNQILRKRYNLNEFVYYFFKQTNSLCTCLATLRSYNLFIELYLHFSMFRTVDQFANFIIDIVIQLQQKKAPSLIATFHKDIIDIISYGDSVTLQDMKQYHDLVAKYMLLNKMDRQNPYLAIYFSAVLQIRLKGKMDHQMMRVVRQGLSTVDMFTKRILLDLYYQQYAFYYPISKKKQRYLMIRHLKYKCQKISLKKIINAKLIVNRNMKVFDRITFLKQSIKKYHKKSQNIKLEKQRQEASQ